MYQDPTKSVQDYSEKAQQNMGILREKSMEQGIVEIRNAYTDARARQMAAASGPSMPGELRNQLRALIGKLDGVIAAADTMRMIVPMPDLIPDGNSAGQVQRPYAREFISVAMNAKAEQAANGLQGADDMAQALIAAAYAASAPERPLSATDAQIADRKADLTRILDGAGTPQATGAAASTILKDALAADDVLTLYVLLGAPMRFVLQGLKGTSAAGLQAAYVKAKLADGVTEYSLVPGVACGAFLAVQDDRGVEALPELAKAYYDARLAQVNRILALSYVQQHMTA